MRQFLKIVLKSIIERSKLLLITLFPRNCYACKNTLARNETTICTRCLYFLPRTNSHLEPNNQIEKLFWGKVKIEEAYSYLFFNKETRIQELMHQYKYHKRKEIGVLLGRIYGTELKNNQKLTTIDLIVPVPLHKKRLIKRGFNQSEWFVRGLSKSLDIPYDFNTLFRVIDTNSQTKRTRTKRWRNMENAFAIFNSDKFKNKHILLIDDIITTGSTLESCIIEILKVSGTKVSVLSLGVA